jgi:hypothetical protein
MSGKRPKIQHKQLRLAFASEGRVENPDTKGQGTEPLVAKPALESPAQEERLMEEVCDRQNLEIAWKRVRGTYFPLVVVLISRGFPGRVNCRSRWS